MNAGLRQSRQAIRRHSRSFSLAQRLLPAESRDGAAVVYAWCRRADDAVDEVPKAEGTTALGRLERELDQIYAGIPQADPLLESFRHVVERCRIPEQYPRELLAGMRMDVEDNVYETLDELYLYCYRVAGTVGLMMCHVMGVGHPRALRHAVHLGIAMQLTNICRDIVEDWTRQRLYLPRSLLGRALPMPGAARAFPAARKQEFARAVERLLLAADRFYASADQGLCYLAPRSRWAVLVARLVYSRIGHVIRARGADVTRGRAYVPLAFKLWLLLQGTVHVLRSLSHGAAASRRHSASLPPLRYPVDVLPV
jgi:15-cis-phytoene synthase